MKIRQSLNGFKRISDNKKFNLKQLGHLIREGHKLHIISISGKTIDVTMRTLVMIAFSNHITNRITGNEKMLSLLEEIGCFLGEDNLYDIIENGGYENYNKRVNNGFIEKGLLL